MKVELAYPLEIEGKMRKADEVVEVNDIYGRNLIHDGLAREHVPAKAEKA